MIFVVRPGSKETNEKDEKGKKDLEKEQHLKRRMMLLQKKCPIRLSAKETNEKKAKEVKKEQQVKRKMHPGLRMLCPEQ
jgi:hypothetical protein